MKKYTYLVVILAVSLGFTTFSCKTTKGPVTLTKSHIVNDTLIRHQVETIVLPTRNTLILRNPCKDTVLNLNEQTVSNGTTDISLDQRGEDIYIEVDIDSIVNVRLEETRIKNDIKEVEIPVYVEVPKKNPINWYLVLYASATSLWIVRKPLISLVRRLIIPLP